MNFIERYLHGKISLFIIGLLFLTNIFSISYFIKNSREANECVCEECPSSEIEKETEVSKIKVDIKGYVKKPGVYELDKDTILNELIKMAGGLKKNGTTENINLSKKLKDEDMIVILSQAELKKQNATSVLKSSTTNTNNNKNDIEKETSMKKISINTASKEELMTLNGIGEAKALLIIEYRAKTPFKEISEIKNISGIGESIYEKIKDTITI